MSNIWVGIKRFFKNKNTVTILAVVVSLVIIYFAYNARIKKATEPQSVPYAVKNIEPRTKITEEILNNISTFDYEDLISSIENFEDIDAQLLKGLYKKYKYIKIADKSCNRREDCNFYGVDSYSNYYCYDICDNFSEYGTNKCLDYCDSNQYRANEDPYGEICFSSCKEIPGGEYIYEGTDGICYKSYSSCEAYYKKADGILKCSSISDCVTNNKKYILNKECRDNCDGYYQLEII